MTAAALLADLHQRGATARVLPTGKLRIEPASAIDDALLADLKAQRDEIIAELRCRSKVEAGGALVDPVLVAARLLRLGQWPATAPACAFFIGPAGAARCARCGAPWIEHYPPARGGGA